MKKMSSNNTDVSVVQAFLAAFGERNLDTAATFLAPGAAIISVGGRRFTSVHEMAAAARHRYQWIRKRIEQIDASQRPDGDSVVYVSGTLYGVNRHGVEFSDIRFIDRFTLRRNKIVLQEVWNDLAETGTLDAVLREQ